MQTTLIQEPLSITVYGFGDLVTGQQYAATGFKLMNRMWQVIKEHAIPNKGKNIWIYEPGNRMFAGVELEQVLPQEQRDRLEVKKIDLPDYAYYKHIGAYDLIGRSGKRMREELAENGTAVGDVYIEIYGHWDADDSKLETELIMSISNKQ